MWIHAIRVRMGHPRGFQTLNWPQASHYCESGTFYLIWGQIWKTSVPGFGWSLLWLGPVQVHEKICLEVSNPYSQPLVLGNVKKTAPKPPFRNRAAQPTRTTNVQFFFLPSGSGLSRPTYRNHIWTQFLHKKSGQIEITWLFTFFHTVFSSFLLT